MRKKILLIIFIILAACCSLQAAQIQPIEPFSKNDRVLILSPHPDDETIACAGIIQRALKAGAQVHVAYLTNGDHNQLAFMVYEKRLTLRKGEFIHMGEVRRTEATCAMKLLGLSRDNLTFLGYPDFGTFTIFSQYWQSPKPYKSFLTRISSVPYKEDLSYGSPYIAESMLSDVEKVLLQYKPDKIFVSHPADTNVDHRTFYLLLQIALCDLSKQLPQPKIYPYLVHCVGWPKPRHFHPELYLDPPDKFAGNNISWITLDLTLEELSKKYQAILCNKSQTESSAFYLLAFARKNELFGDYPGIELPRQISAKGQGVSFSGFSSMFTDADTGILSGQEHPEENKGQVSYAVVDNTILIRIEKPKEIRRPFSLQLHLFGYSGKTSFAAMPKIRIVTKNTKFKVFDGRKMIKPQGISLDLNAKTLILKVPLEALGNPDFILTSMKTYSGVLPFDATAFRKIYIK